MSFEYGSETLGIKNPFRVEGLLFSIRGLIVAAMGAYLLFTVKGVVHGGSTVQAWGHMIVGLVLLAGGLTALGRGGFKTFRFFVGRSVPASLCKNLAQSESHMHEDRIAYKSKDIEQMLMGRKNLTFLEPEGWIGRLTYTVFPNLLFMPYPIRNITQRVIAGAIYTLFFFLLYGLAMFSGATGLLSISGTPVADWFAAALTVAMLVFWLKKSAPLSKTTVADTVEPANARWLAFMIAAAILAPFAMGWLHGIYPLPPLPFSPFHWMVFTGLMVVLTAVFVVGLAVFRMQGARPLTNVSEYRDHWQENLHPMDIFRAFNMIMADFRYKEIPNRVYREFDPKLMIQGSEDKGDFRGDIIQETQPIHMQGQKNSKQFEILRLSCAIAAQILFVLSAVWLFRAPGRLDAVHLDRLANVFLPPLIFCIFAVLLQKAAHLYWAEMHFKSFLVHFFAEGTYTESKLSTGMSIYDSNRSENPVVRSSLSPWILASEIVTCCFASTGRDNLESHRYVMEMHKSDETLDLALAKLRQFIDERQIIAGVKSEKDLESAGNIYRMNVATRPRLDGAPAYPQIPETDKKNGVAHEGGNPHRPKDSRNGWDENQE